MKDLRKGLKNRFRLKYLTLLILLLSFIIGMIAIGVYIKEYTKQEPHSLCPTVVLIALVVLSIALAFVYEWKYEGRILAESLAKQDINGFIEEYLKIFADEKLSFWRYSEYVFWFSREIQFLYRHRETNDLVNNLYTGLRMNKAGTNIAGLHMNSFIQLCKDIIKEECLEEKKNVIIQGFEDMQSMKKQTRKIPLVVSNRHIICYFAVLTLNSIGCGLVADGCREILGNLLIVLPTDFLAILIYKGYIDEKENSTCKFKAHTED